jgi:hypothetical protein
MRPSARKSRIHASLTGPKNSNADSQSPLVCAADVTTIYTYVITSGVTAGHNLNWFSAVASCNVTGLHEFLTHLGEYTPQAKNGQHRLVMIKNGKNRHYDGGGPRL